MTEIRETSPSSGRTLVDTMLHYWHAGLRDDAFHAAVRAEFPDCVLRTYNEAANEAWNIIQGRAS